MAPEGYSALLPNELFSEGWGWTSSQSLRLRLRPRAANVPQRSTTVGSVLLHNIQAVVAEGSDWVNKFPALCPKCGTVTNFVGTSAPDGVNNKRQNHSVPPVESIEMVATNAAAEDPEGPCSATELEKLLLKEKTVEDMSKTLYEYLQNTHVPNFCQGVQLDQDGGLDDIDRRVWTRQKYVWCLFLLLSVLFNMFLLIIMNRQIVESFMFNYIQRHASEMGSFLTNLYRGAFMSELTSGHALNQKELQAALVRQENQDLFQHIEDPQTRMTIVSLASIMSVAEVSGILILFIRALRQLCVFGRSSSEYKAFQAIDALFHETLPSMSNFSMIQLFGLVHPSMLYTSYLNTVMESAWGDSLMGEVFLFIWFAITRMVCCALAVTSFSLKMLAVTFKMLNPQYSLVMRIASVVALMNNCVCCIHVESLLQDRLFLFIFGGVDAQYQDLELAFRNVFRCRLSKVIWQKYWKTGQYLKALAMYTTFDHYDLQALVLLPPAAATESLSDARPLVLDKAE